MWRCWVLGFGVMWCCAVMSPQEGLDLLTACLQTVGGRYLLQQFHHSPINSFQPILLSISSFGGKQLSTSGSRFLVLSNAHWWIGLAVSILFVPFWNSPLSAHWQAIENISVGKLAPLSRILPNLHHMEGVTHVLETLNNMKKNCTQKKGKLNRDACSQEIRGRKR